jgi:ABC-type transport system substrate-binding protein
VNLTCSQAGTSNHSFYCSRRFGAFFADQARTSSEEQRDRDFDAMQQLVHDDVPAIPEYYEILFKGVSNRVTGYALNMLFLPVNAENWDAR